MPLVTSVHPTKIESFVPKVSAHLLKSTKAVKSPSQQDSPAQPTLETDATVLQQTKAPPKHSEVILPLFRLSGKTLSEEVTFKLWTMS